MEEKILVKSELLIHRKLLHGITASIVIIAILLPILLCYGACDDNFKSIWKHGVNSYKSSRYRNMYVYEDEELYTAIRLAVYGDYDSAESFAAIFCRMVFYLRYDVDFETVFAIGLYFSIAVFVIYLWLRNYELVVTDKRVYGRVGFGKRVDLPIDSVSAIGTKWLKGIAIATASGKVSFLMIKNRDEIHQCVSDLLIDRQAKNSTPVTIKQEIPQSNTDEIKKYKELLDIGAITQEEFDAKKKQLLGL